MANVWNVEALNEHLSPHSHVEGANSGTKRRSRGRLGRFAVGVTASFVYGRRPGAQIGRLGQQLAEE